MSSFPIDQKRNVIDIENAMLHAVSILDSVKVQKKSIFRSNGVSC